MKLGSLRDVMINKQDKQTFSLFNSHWVPYTSSSLSKLSLVESNLSI